MPTAEAFDLAAEFKVAFYGGIVQNAEAIDYGDAVTGNPENFIRIEVQIGLMSDRKDNGIGALYRCR